jgi:hypothetical protein
VWWLFIPLIVLGSILLLFGLLVVLGRFRGGALLRPIVATLSRVGFLRRMFQKASTAAIERQNPDLAGAIKKLQVVGQNPTPQALQKAMSRLTPAERRAYMEAAQEQGAVPEATNRQQRRRVERMQTPSRPGASGRPSGGSGGKRGGKKRR